MSNLHDIAETPVRTTLKGAIAILVPTALVIFAATIYLVNSDRDHDDYERSDIAQEKVNAKQDETLAILATSLTQNTIDLNIVITEVKNTDENVKNLTTLLNTVIDSL